MQNLWNPKNFVYWWVLCFPRCAMIENVINIDCYVYFQICHGTSLVGVGKKVIDILWNKLMMPNNINDMYCSSKQIYLKRTRQFVMNPASMKTILCVIPLLLFLPKYNLGSGWGFEEVLQFCFDNGLKFVTFADINNSSGNHHYNWLIKRESLFRIQVRLFELVDDFEDVTNRNP